MIVVVTLHCLVTNFKAFNTNHITNHVYEYSYNAKFKYWVSYCCIYSISAYRKTSQLTLPVILASLQ